MCESEDTIFTNLTDTADDKEKKKNEIKKTRKMKKKIMIRRISGKNMSRN